MSDEERGIDCEEAIRRLAEYLDGELADREEAEVERRIRSLLCRFGQAS